MHQAYQRFITHLRAKIPNHIWENQSFKIEYSNTRMASVSNHPDLKLKAPTTMISVTSSSKKFFSIAIIHNTNYRFYRVKGTLLNKTYDGYVHGADFIDTFIGRKKEIYVDDMSGLLTLSEIVDKHFVDIHTVTNIYVNEFWDKYEEQTLIYLETNQEVKSIAALAQEEAERQYGEAMRQAEAEYLAAACKKQELRMRYDECLYEVQKAHDWREKVNTALNTEKILVNASVKYKKSMTYFDNEIRDF